MNNPFEELKEQIIALQNQIQSLDKKILGEKRWLNIKETAHYLGYSKEYLHKLKDSSFILGVHYYKKSGKLLFDKDQLDLWVTTIDNKIDVKQLADEILKDLI